MLLLLLLLVVALIKWSQRDETPFIFSLMLARKVYLINTSKFL
ncbi:hypothetical protein SLEP1_g5761 [Rubroshorea leprosula]|uniref:Uncharacterized protein n=1 Tax=Rubroshorea leprosula TaxID=152421 RepID=A0AAV5I2L0_9ROSI|nr:hypothetical protein SLEP1_g5761 [Rubroshorea leprosula]